MLEIFFISALAIKNKDIVELRGRKSTGFILLTIALWLGFEFTGALIALIMGFDGFIMYLSAFVFAVLGGALSYFIAKNCTPGDYVPVRLDIVETSGTDSSSDKELLSKEHTIKIIRDNSFVGIAVPYDLTLNGQNIGEVKNNKFITVKSSSSQNVIIAKVDLFGRKTKPFSFQINSDTDMAEIHIKAGKFLPKKCHNCTPINSKPTKKR